MMNNLLKSLMYAFSFLLVLLSAVASSRVTVDLECIYLIDAAIFVYLVARFGLFYSE